MQVNVYMRIIYKYYIENEFTKDVLLVIMVDDTREMNKKDSKKEEIVMNWRKLGQKITVLLLAVMLCVGNISIAAHAADA